MIKIYDCSNSNERPSHNLSNLGPVENDIMRDLKIYANYYGFNFVDNVSNADVVITNDIFPSTIKKLTIPKVKRMDGIYWKNDLKSRNGALNESAALSNLVIFISNFSRMSLMRLYPDVFLKLNTAVVVVNYVDTSIFQRIDKYLPIEPTFIWSACASNWSREEKRLNELIRFSSVIDKNDVIQVIGKCDCDLPNNMIKIGYVSNDSQKSKILQNSHAFVNFSYRDAGSKVVCQAVACGLPIFYADSGSITDLIYSHHGLGRRVPDTKSIYFKDGVPNLLLDDIRIGYKSFKQDYYNMVEYIKQQEIFDYQETIYSYFQEIRKVL